MYSCKIEIKTKLEKGQREKESEKERERNIRCDWKWTMDKRWGIVVNEFKRDTSQRKKERKKVGNK